MLVLLAQLAYNLITWTRRSLAVVDRHLAHFGPLRMVRDVYHIPAQIQLDAQGHILQITLRASQLYAWAVAHALSTHDVSLILGQI